MRRSIYDVKKKREMNAYCGDGYTELAHGMEGGRASVENFLDELGNGRTSSPILGKGGDLLLGGHLTGKEEPEEGFRKRLLATWCSWKELLALGNGLSAKADTLFGIEDGAFPDEGGKTSHTTRWGNMSNHEYGKSNNRDLERTHRVGRR